MTQTHARFSPSKLETLDRCVRFKRIETPDAAEDGQLLHRCLELETFDGLNEEQRSAAIAAKDYADSVKAGLGDPALIEDRKEARLELRDITWGFADRIFIVRNAHHAELLDYKFGRLGATGAAFNFQIQTYCAALFEMEPDLQTIKAHIVAPRARTDDPVHLFTRELLAGTRSRIEELYRRIEDPFTPPTPAPDLCKDCTRVSQCPAVMPAVTAVAPVAATFQMPSYLSRHKLNEFEALATPEDRGEFQDMAYVLERIAEQIRESNKRAQERGVSVAGYRVTERSTGMKIPRENTRAAVQALVESGYASEDMISDSMELKIKQLADQMAELRGTSAADEKLRIREVLGSLAVEGSCSFLAREKRFKPALLLA